MTKTTTTTAAAFEGYHLDVALNDLAPAVAQDMTSWTAAEEREHRERAERWEIDAAAAEGELEALRDRLRHGDESVTDLDLAAAHAHVERTRLLEEAGGILSMVDMMRESAAQAREAKVRAEASKTEAQRVTDLAWRKRVEGTQKTTDNRSEAEKAEAARVAARNAWVAEEVSRIGRGLGRRTMPADLLTEAEKAGK